MQVVRIADKLAEFSDHWSPRVVGELNGQQVKLVKFRGEFVWHHHADEDEMFLVISGQFRMEYRENGEEKAIELHEGEFIIVPRGTDHRPVAQDEVAVILFEPATTLRKGNAESL
jgi:mannose-6-phosphate isomerase-like protein (cupin superfamily)